MPDALTITFKMPTHRPREAVTPPQSPPTPTTTRIARQLALSWHLNRLLESGEIQSPAAAARMLSLSRPRLTQILNLRFLSPDLQAGLLAGELRLSERRLRRVALSVEWNRQLTALKAAAAPSSARSADSANEQPMSER
ncbi:MAG: hypothetical protein HYR85_19995 [Planctomycetes bacterium]|nr:hypothetical protein [Planctomycetota bacterium]MBI3844512.1 hypothetical protein [Planctomycetota bacterium]